MSFLVTAMLRLPALIVWPKWAPFIRSKGGLLGLLGLLPGMAWALGLPFGGFGGRHLIWTGEVWFFLFFLGSFSFFLPSRFFRKGLGLSLLLVLIILTLAVFTATVLGFGVPLKKFGPPLIYQRHITQSARITALCYMVLIIGLYRVKREWFSPRTHGGLFSLFLIFFPALIVYLANGFADYVGDTTFNSQLAWNLLLGKGFFYTKEYVAAHGNFGLLEIGDHYLPKFPMGPGFLGLPTALLQYLFSREEIARLISLNQKMTAAWTAALAAALMFQILYLESQNLRLSLLLTAGFALGTSQLTISAATLWQHGPAVLFLCLGLLFLVKGQKENPNLLPLAALPLAFLFLMRPQAVLLYLAGLVTVAFLQPKKIPQFILFSLPGIFLTLWINLGLYHSLWGGSGYQADSGNFTAPLRQGALGLLFSPNRGLFLFSPFLILGVIGAVRLWAERSVLAISFGAAALVFFLVHAKWVAWHGGYCVAPRFTSELVPLLVFFSLPWFLRVRRTWARFSGTFLILVSLAIHLPSHFYLFENGQWNVFPDVDRHQEERVWDYQDWLPVHFRHFVGLTRFRETPAYAFVVTAAPTPLPSKEYHYRVEVNLEPRPVEIIKLTNVPLEKGSYQVLFRGEALDAEGARADVIIGFVGHKVEERNIPLRPQSPLLLVHPLEMDRAGYVDIRLLLSGRGALIIDSVQLLPAGKIP